MAEKASPSSSTESNVAGLNAEVQEEEIAGTSAGAGWSGWLSTTLSSAKEKSTEMLQYLKQDLSEFSDTVQEAGRDLKEKLKLEDTATTVGSKMNTLLEQMSTIFGVGPDDDDEEIYLMNHEPMVVDRVQAKIYALGVEENVFLKDPENLEDYDKWMATFDCEEKNQEIIDLLTANPHLQLHYSQLVPDKVSHLVFWHRFYFQVKLIFDAEKRSSRAPVVRNIENDFSAQGDLGTSIEDHGMVEISEEDQRRLLAEYEEEMKQGDEDSGRNSRRSSGTQVSSSSSSSFAFVTHDAVTDELKVD